MSAEHAPMLGANEGSILAFDYGAKRIGVAVGDSSLKIAHAVESVMVSEDQERWKRVDALVAEWEPILFVLGLPTHADGSEHKLAPAIRGFGNKLKKRYQVSVHYIDERLSSYAASRKLSEAGVSTRHQKGKLDSAAAREILQSYFDEWSHGRA